MQITAASNGMGGVNNSLNPPSASTSATASTIVGLLHQNSMNSRQQNSVNNASSPYAGGNSVQAPSPGSSNTMPQPQQQPQPQPQPQPSNPSPFQSPTPSSSNNPPQPTSHGALTAPSHMNSTSSPANISTQQPAISAGEADQSDSQSAVQKIINEMIMCSQLNGSGGMVGVGSLGNDKNVNGILPAGNHSVLNATGNSLVGNGTVNNNNSVIAAGGYGNMGGGVLGGQSAMVNGIRAAMGGNNSMMNGRVGMTNMGRDQSMNNHQQQDLGNQLLGLGAVNNGFNNIQFETAAGSNGNERVWQT